MDADYDYEFKSLLIGDSAVGKTCLLLRECDDKYTESFVSTIGVDYKLKTLMMSGGRSCRLQVWDTAGQERFRTITSSYYHGSHIIFVCYDISDNVTFTNVKQWLEEISRYASSFVTTVLVGCKSDLEEDRVVSFETGKELANEMGIGFIETSAKTGSHVNEAFLLGATLCIEKDRAPPPSNLEIVDISFSRPQQQIGLLTMISRLFRSSSSSGSSFSLEEGEKEKEKDKKKKKRREKEKKKEKGDKKKRKKEEKEKGEEEKKKKEEEEKEKEEEEKKRKEEEEKKRKEEEEEKKRKQEQEEEEEEEEKGKEKKNLLSQEDIDKFSVKFTSGNVTSNDLKKVFHQIPPSTPLNRYQDTAFHLATRNVDLYSARLLHDWWLDQDALSSFVPSHFVNHHGDTPLHLLVYFLPGTHWSLLEEFIQLVPGNLPTALNVSNLSLASILAKRGSKAVPLLANLLSNHPNEPWDWRAIQSACKENGTLGAIEKFLPREIRAMKLPTQLPFAKVSPKEHNQMVDSVLSCPDADSLHESLKSLEVPVGAWQSFPMNDDTFVLYEAARCGNEGVFFEIVSTLTRLKFPMKDIDEMGFVWQRTVQILILVGLLETAQKVVSLYDVPITNPLLSSLFSLHNSCDNSSNTDRDDDGGNCLCHCFSTLTFFLERVHNLIEISQTVCDEKGGNLLHLIAAQSGNSRLAEYLISKMVQEDGKQKERLLSDENDEGLVPLHIATMHANESLCRYFFSLFPDKPLFSICTKRKESFLHLLSCTSSSLIERGGIVSLFLERLSFEKSMDSSLSIDAQNKDGSTPLLLAVQNMNAPMCQKLLNASADPTIKDNNEYTPLHWASLTCNLATLKELLQFPDCNPNIQTKKSQVTPLHLLVSQSDNDVPVLVELLLNWGANPLIPDCFGSTSLHRACLNGRTDVLEKLKMKTSRSDLCLQDDNGNTPFHLALWKKHEDLVIFLFDWVCETGEAIELLKVQNKMHLNVLQMALSQGLSVISQKIFQLYKTSFSPSDYWGKTLALNFYFYQSPSPHLVPLFQPQQIKINSSVSFYIRDLTRSTFAAFLVPSSKPVIVKAWQDMETISAFHSEVSTLSLLGGKKGIVELLGVVNTEKKKWIVLDQVNGMRLSQLIYDEQLFKSKTPQEKEKMMLQLSLNIAKLIHLLHTHPIPILHGDINPDNIIVDESFFPTLIDFEASQIFWGCEGDPEAKLEPSISVKRVVAYTAPEVWGTLGIDRSVDIHSFGLTLYYLFTRTIPFSQEGVSPLYLRKAIEEGLRPAIPASVPPGISSLISQCIGTSKRPTITSVVQLLEKEISGQLSLGPPAPCLEEIVHSGFDYPWLVDFMTAKQVDEMEPFVGSVITFLMEHIPTQKHQDSQKRSLPPNVLKFLRPISARLTWYARNTQNKSSLLQHRDSFTLFHFLQDTSLGLFTERNRGQFLLFHEMHNVIISRSNPLGSGTFGSVYQMELEDTHEQVAVKIIPRLDPQGLAREMTVMALVHHPNLVQLHGVVFDHELDECLLVMELGTCDVLGYLKKIDNPSLSLQYSLLHDLCLGLEYLAAHHIVHRDIKSDNAMVFQQGSGPIAKLCDLGTACPDSGTVFLAGTPLYLPPEHYPKKGALIVSVKPALSADVFSFACLMFEILCVVSWIELYEKCPNDSPYPWMTQEATKILRTHQLPSSLFQVVLAGWSAQVRSRPTAKAILTTIERERKKIGDE